MLAFSYTELLIEAGCDEAGRGCLAGPVFAATVILPKGFQSSLLNDSKKLTEKQRNLLRIQIEREAEAWKVEAVDNEEIDRINILSASFLAMNKAVMGLNKVPDLLLIDGNRFRNQTSIEYKCIVKGDAQFMSIAAASILAKTHRDEYMLKIHDEYPVYCWDKNKGYPTEKHFDAIKSAGLTKYHRRTFNTQKQLKIEF